MYTILQQSEHERVMLQKDGKCDDGSLSGHGEVWCDLGTDCTDCGPWTLKVPEAEASQSLAKPIQLLRGRQVMLCNSTSTMFGHAIDSRKRPMSGYCMLMTTPRRLVVGLQATCQNVFF